MKNNLPNEQFAQWLQSENGRATRLSKQINVSPVVMSKYKTGFLAITLAHAVEIERHTNGLFKAESLCPKYAGIITYLRGEVA